MNHTEILQKLPAALREQFHESCKGFASPTVLGLKFGNTAALAKITHEAQQLAAFADQCSRDWRAIHDTHWRMQADPTATEAARLVRSATHARQRLDALGTRYNQLLDATEGRIRQLESVLGAAMKPPANAGEAAVDSDVRRHIAGLREDARGAAIEAAAANPQTLRALVSAPAFLSKLAPAKWEGLRDRYLESVAPDEYKAFRDLQAAAVSAQQAHTTLVSGAKGLIDFESAAAIEKARVV